MNKNWLFGIACLLMISLVVLSFTQKSQPSKTLARVRTIVVDAGHGFRGTIGARHGAFGSEISEDQISYEVTKRIVEQLKKELPDVTILESRPSEYFVENKARAEYANSHKGDLFVSIHCNFVPKLREVRREGTRTETYYVYTGKGKKRKKIKKTRQVPIYKTYYHPNPAHGTETYVFASHKTDEKEDIILENGDVFQHEKDDSTINVNINDPVVKQQVALWTKQFFSNSVKLATIVEEEFVSIGRFSRGVKQRQKGIWVLQATAMPSILIELGFLSHRPEEEFLISAEGQQQMAESIARSIKRYKELVDKGPTVQNGNNGPR